MNASPSSSNAIMIFVCFMLGSPRSVNSYDCIGATRGKNSPKLVRASTLYSFLSSGPRAYTGCEDGEVLHRLVAPPLNRLIPNLPSCNKVIDSRHGEYGMCSVPATLFTKHILEDVVAISHTWVAPAELKYPLTSANCHTWPAPLPPIYFMPSLAHRAGLGAPLSTSTIAEREELRMKEWESDVPLIRAIY
ncbi:hypothetical protein EV426DRAFT_582688 [Tirmania nivea]|nr:hypothetical protein EV426DRAFT_582688 [Tirmania nivea]